MAPPSTASPSPPSAPKPTWHRPLPHRGPHRRPHRPRLRHARDRAPPSASTPAFADTARAALHAGAPILCDAKMVAHGITRPRLPAANARLVHAGPPRNTSALATSIGNTRSAAALELWREHLRRRARRHRQRAHRAVPPARPAGRRRPSAPPPSSALPVGFVGAAESKAEPSPRLPRPMDDRRRPPRRQRHGRRRRQRPRERPSNDGPGNPGTLHIVGTGPGDPELLTLKAVRILASSPVTAWFRQARPPGPRPPHRRPPTSPRRRRPAPLRIPLHHRNPGRSPRYTPALTAFYDASAADHRRPPR